MLHAGVVYEIPSGEVVRAIDQYVAGIDELLHIGMVDVGDDWFNDNFRIDLFDMTGCGDCLGKTFFGITLGEHRLSLQV